MTGWGVKKEKEKETRPPSGRNILLERSCLDVGHYIKKIICLANSYKDNGRCIAGKELLTNGSWGWIRPVSASATAEVSLEEFRYENNQIPQLLDIVQIPFLRAEPRHYQTENHVIDPEYYWIKTGAASWDDLKRLVDQPASLWINRDSTKAGWYDCMSLEEATSFQGSLFLIGKQDFTVEIGRRWDGKKSYRGRFDYKGTHHSFSLTDPVVRTAFAFKEEGGYPLKDVYLCVSLTEPYIDGRCHKLVAAVFSEQRLG